MTPSFLANASMTKYAIRTTDGRLVHRTLSRTSAGDRATIDGYLWRIKDSDEGDPVADYKATERLRMDWRSPYWRHHSAPPV